MLFKQREERTAFQIPCPQTTIGHRSCIFVPIPCTRQRRTNFLFAHGHLPHQAAQSKFYYNTNNSPSSGCREPTTSSLWGTNAVSAWGEPTKGARRWWTLPRRITDEGVPRSPCTHRRHGGIDVFNCPAVFPANDDFPLVPFLVLY